MVYENALDNRAYIEGYVRGIQADGLDWAQARVELLKLEETMKHRLAEKDRLISKLRGEINKRDERILDLESQIEAHKIAWRHRHEEA